MNDEKTYRTEIVHKNGVTQEDFNNWRNLITVLTSCIQQLVRNKRLSAKRIVIEEVRKMSDKDLECREPDCNFEADTLQELADHINEVHGPFISKLEAEED